MIHCTARLCAKILLPNITGVNSFTHTYTFSPSLSLNHFLSILYNPVNKRENGIYIDPFLLFAEFQ